MTTASLDASALDLLFRDAHTHRTWERTPVTDEELRQLYDVLKFGPTSANSTPARFVFVRSPAAKERLLPIPSPGNVEQTRAAPVTVIIAQDSRFYEEMPRLYPSAPDFKKGLEANPSRAERMAFQGSSLQGAYLIITARALGFDVGPMGGFDNAKLDAEFFPDGRYKSNFLMNLGHADRSKAFPRNPRLSFDEACEVV